MSRYINSVNQETIIKVILAYLRDELSHRDIQREILGLPAPQNGGGFVAMNILHHFDILGEKKGVLKHKTIIEEIQTSEGNYKAALIIVKDYMETERFAQNSLKNGQYSYIGKSTELEAETIIRINQNVLRKFTLQNYNNQCALCDIDKIDLLFCSHIKPWAIDSDNRLNPQNAICFCVLHDRLFDRGYFGLNENYKIVFTPKADLAIRRLLENNEFKIPNQFPPDHEFLKYHLNEVCK